MTGRGAVFWPVLFLVVFSGFAPLFYWSWLGLSGEAFIWLIRCIIVVIPSGSGADGIGLWGLRTVRDTWAVGHLGV